MPIEATKAIVRPARSPMRTTCRTPTSRAGRSSGPLEAEESGGPVRAVSAMGLGPVLGHPLSEEPGGPEDQDDYQRQEHHHVRQLEGGGDPQSRQNEVG